MILLYLDRKNDYKHALHLATYHSFLRTYDKRIELHLGGISKFDVKKQNGRIGMIVSQTIHPLVISTSCGFYKILIVYNFI